MVGWGSFMMFENLFKEGVVLDSKFLGRIIGFGVLIIIGGFVSGGI